MKKYIVLFVLILIQGCSSGGDSATSTSTTQSALVGTWVEEACTYISATDNYLQRRREYSDTTMTFTADFHDVPSCTDIAYQLVFISVDVRSYTVGGVVTTSSGLSAIEINYTDDATGEVYYSIYKIDDLGRLYVGITTGVNDGSTVERRHTELDSDFYNKR